MEENLLGDLKVDEESLEGNLYNIGEDNDWSIIGRQLSGAKKLAIQYQQSRNRTTIPSQNHFVDMKHVIVGGKAVIYPSLRPSTEIEAKIIGYKPVFGGNCALVLGECDGRQFLFFDPESRDYKQLLSTRQKIKLAAISSGTGHSDFEPDFGDVFDQEQREEFIRSGYAKSRLLSREWQIPLYRTVFDVTGVKSVQGPNYFLQVKNPLDQNSSLDLITASRELDPKDLEKLVTGFYFLGRL